MPYRPHRLSLVELFADRVEASRVGCVFSMCKKKKKKAAGSKADISV